MCRMDDLDDVMKNDNGSLQHLRDRTELSQLQSQNCLTNILIVASSTEFVVRSEVLTPFDEKPCKIQNLKYDQVCIHSN